MAAEIDPSMIQGAWLLMLESDYVWRKPVQVGGVAPGASENRPATGSPGLVAGLAHRRHHGRGGGALVFQIFVLAPVGASCTCTMHSTAYTASQLIPTRDATETIQFLGTGRRLRRLSHGPGV